MRRSDDDKVGTIEHVMIDKRTGRIGVVYAAMSFGGFLGVGSEYRAPPTASSKRPHGANFHLVAKAGNAGWPDGGATRACRRSQSYHAARPSPLRAERVIASIAGLTCRA